MKRQFLFLLLIMWCPLLSGQRSAEILNTYRASIITDIDVAAGKIAISSYPPVENSPLKSLHIGLQYGELHIEYQLSPLSREDQYYEIVPTVLLNDTELKGILFQNMLGDVGKLSSGGSKKMIWTQILEEYGNLAGTLTLTLTVNIWGPIILYDCDFGPPVFSTKQKLPYYIGAGVGIAGLAGGGLSGNANGKTLTALGGAILLVDGILYLFREGKYKRDLKNYNIYCQPGRLSMNAFYSPIPLHKTPLPLAPPGGAIGLKLTFSF